MQNMQSIMYAGLETIKQKKKKISFMEHHILEM